VSSVYIDASRHPAHAGPPVLRIDDGRGTFGMSLLITSEALLFAVLFFAYYYLESGNPQWKVHDPPKLHYSLPMLAILLISSVVLHWGEKRVKEGRRSAGRWGLIATIVLGFVFLILSYLEYSEHLRHVTPTTDSYGSIFYTIVSLHVVHLSMGLLMLFWVLFLPNWEPRQRTPHRPYHNAAMYWHFVDTVWIFIIILLYAIPNIWGMP
jgi:heme/copper-type cytochrome/quinol oxidase subunit 3